jgi:hypothetical protein
MEIEKAFILAGVAVVFIISIVIIAIIMTDTFTDDERNQLPRCDTAEEVLVGSGDFYSGRWDEYRCFTPS